MKDYKYFKDSIIDELEKQKDRDLLVENSVMLRYSLKEQRDIKKDVNLLKSFRLKVIQTIVVITTSILVLASIVTFAETTKEVFAFFSGTTSKNRK